MIDENPDDGYAAITERLGTPEADYRVSKAWFWGKLTLGILLVTYGLIATIIWVTVAKAKGGHFLFHVIFWPPILGMTLLWHILKNRGVRVLVYPTGILHIRPGKIESFPYDEIAQVTLKSAGGLGYVLQEQNGTILNAWYDVPNAYVRIWASAVTLTRKDGARLQVNSVLKDYPDLAGTIQRMTFGHLWPVVLSAFHAGERIPFGEFYTVDRDGIYFQKKMLPWDEFKQLTVSQKILTIGKHGRWMAWRIVQIETVPNPHILLALVTEAKRLQVLPPTKEPHATDPSN